jgi:iron complex outermembrane receptor protein
MLKINRRARLGLLASASIFGLAEGGGAMAADATPADASTGIDEIVVTAQKRSENVQDVPISIVALTGAALQKSGVTTIDSLQHFAPGLSISSVGSGFVSYTYLRGSGTNQVDPGSDPSVAYFVDEVYIGGTAGLQFDLFDIDRVEVLKGPQGTLFGRNAAAGAISIVTKRPSATPTATADAEVGDYGYVTARGSVSGPFGGDDHWRYRLSGGYKRRGAFTENAAPGGEDPGKVDSYGARGQIEYAGDKLNFLLTAEGMEARNGMTNQFLSTANKSGLVSAAALATLPTDESFYRHYYNVAGHENQDLGAISARFDLHTDIGVITSISAYRDNSFDRLQDQDGTLADSFALYSHEHDKTFSQELRLASDFGRLHLISGLYYYYGQVHSHFTASAGPAFPTGIVQNHQAIDDSLITSKSYAAFSQATLDVTDQLSLTVGGRYTKDKKEDERSVKGFLAPAFYSVDPTADWHSFDPTVTVNYHIMPDVLAYASYRRGYKSGGFQSLFPATPAVASTPFEPEKVDSYEAGLKR